MNGLPMAYFQDVILDGIPKATNIQIFHTNFLVFCHICFLSAHMDHVAMASVYVCVKMDLLHNDVTVLRE